MSYDQDQAPHRVCVDKSIDVHRHKSGSDQEIAVIYPYCETMNNKDDSDIFTQNL